MIRLGLVFLVTACSGSDDGDDGLRLGVMDGAGDLARREVQREDRRLLVRPRCLFRFLPFMSIKTRLT